MLFAAFVTAARRNFSPSPPSINGRFSTVDKNPSCGRLQIPDSAAGQQVPQQPANAQPAALSEHLQQGVQGERPPDNPGESSKPLHGHHSLHIACTNPSHFKLLSGPKKRFLQSYARPPPLPDEGCPNWTRLFPFPPMLDGCADFWVQTRYSSPRRVR